MQKVSSKLPLKKNKNSKTVKIKKLTCKSFPIKDIELIEKIKTTYKKNNNYRGLLAFVLSINTGLKITDLLNLKVGDVSKKDILSIFDTTHNEIMTFILTKEIQKIIPFVVGNRKKDDYLFKTKFGNQMGRVALYYEFNDLCKLLNIENKYSILSWRKTFAYHYYKLTNDIVKLMHIFNQNSIQQALEFIDEEQNINLVLDRKFAL